MEKAFVCIQCQSGKEEEIIHQLNELSMVNARGTLGVYDIIASVESDSLDSMRKIITEQIRKINGITSTITLLETEEEPGLDDLIPDVIPEEKKPLEPPEEMDDEYEEDDDWDDEDDYEETKTRKP